MARHAASLRPKNGIDRRALAAAMVSSFSILFLEIAYFQQLNFLATYMVSNLVISIALLGIAAGGLLAFFAAKHANWLIPTGLILMGPSALAAFFFAARAPDNHLAGSVVMTLPFLCGSLVIGLAFTRERRSNLIYAADLTGAGLGAVAASILIPLIREEGCILLAAPLVTLVAPLCLPPGGTIAHRRAVLLATVLALGLEVPLLVQQLAVDRYNLVMIAGDNRTEGFGAKLFNGERERDQIISAGSLIERIDFYGPRKGGLYVIYYNGLPNDHISRAREHHYDLDRRIPVPFFKGRIEAPQVLVIGASAQGVCKTAKHIAGDEGTVIGVEYNEAILDLTLEREPHLHRAGRYWYEGIDLRVEDARTFLARTDDEFDLITMMNTHRVRTIGLEGPPEYLHTVEAIHSYMDHLTDKGALVLEERNLSPDANAGLHRYLATISLALRERGLDPKDHIVIYEAYVSERGLKYLRQRGVTENSDAFLSYRYAFVVVFKQPVAQDRQLHETWRDWANLTDHRLFHRTCGGGRHCSKKIFADCANEFMSNDYQDQSLETRCRIDRLAESKCSCAGKMGILNIRERHTPWREIDSTFATAVRSEDPSDLLADEGYWLEPAYDDRPFITDVDARQPVVDTMLVITCAITAVFVVPLLLALLVRLWRERGRSSPRPGSTSVLALLVAFAGLVGVAYMLVEIVMIQWLSLFMGSPAASLTLVLPAMLIMSGLGGALTAKFGAVKVLVTLLVIGALSALFHFAMPAALDSLIALSPGARAVSTLVILAPLFLSMGVPFSFALRKAYGSVSPAYPALLFGVNGALGAIATPISIKLSMNLGFGRTMLVGAGLYAALALLMGVIAALDRRNAARKDTAS